MATTKRFKENLLKAFAVSAFAVAGLGAAVVVNSNDLLVTASEYGITSAIDSLVFVGADVKYDYDKAAKESAKHGHLNTLKKLQSHGADLNYNSNETLREAIVEGHLATVEFLIGNDPQISDEKMNFFLALASSCGQAEIATTLIKLGADITPDAIALAAGSRSVETVKLLLDHGADPNVQYGRPLILAVTSNSLKVVELLVNSGANITPDGTAMWHAHDLASSGHPDILLFFEKELKQHSYLQQNPYP